MKPSPSPDHNTRKEGKEKAGHETESQDYVVMPMQRRSNPLSGLLQNVIGGMDASARIHESIALAYWPRVIGAQAAAATEAESVRDGVLVIRTKSSVWSHELTLHKARLLQTINRMLGGKVIHDIIFRAQGLKRQEPKAAEVDTPDADELTAVILEPDERLELRARLRQLYSISDDRIRNSIATRLTNEAKLRHWRLERGWKLCLRCSVPHHTDYDICPQCRLNS